MALSGQFLVLWEAEADAPGGVDRDKDNEPWPDDAPTTFWGLIKLFW